MGISLTIFLGSKDPNLIFSLNQCQTDCCLIDPDDVEKFIGALPAFTMDQFEDILAYTLNIFRQFTFPGYVFQIEKATGARKEKLESCRERLDEILDKQLNWLVSRRYYRELFLHNSLVNIVPASGSYHLSDIKLANNVPVVVVVDDSVETVESLKKLKNAVTLAPLVLCKRLKDAGFTPNIAVTNDPVISDNKCTTELLVLDIVANPRLTFSNSQLVWTSSDSDLNLSHLIEGLLEEKIDAYVNENEFALYVAVELGARDIYLAGSVNSDVRDEFINKNKHVKIKSIAEFPVQKRKRSTPLIELDEHSRDLVPKRILNEVSLSLKKEKAESDIFQALIWSAEYEAVIKLMNGWINFHTINQVQESMEVKKAAFLSLIKMTKATLNTKTDYDKVKFKRLVNSLPHECVRSDYSFELKVLLQSNLILAQEMGKLTKKDMPKDLRLEYAAVNKLDLYIKKSAGTFQYFGYDMNYVEARYDKADSINIIIIPGMMNAELQLMCLEFLPGIPIATLEPRADHMSQVMQLIPVVSTMARSGIWLYGSVKELAEAFHNLLENSDIRPLVLDPDPQNLRDDLTVLKKMMKVDLTATS